MKGQRQLPMGMRGKELSVAQSTSLVGHVAARHLKAPKIVLRKHSIARGSINSDIKIKRIITVTLLKPR